jgi:GNAT superfamily N-acetyltransferase
MRSVRKIQLPFPGFNELVQEASAEGFAFLATTEHEWATGENRFSKPGEAFYAVFVHQLPVAVGALGQDPYLTTPGIGRLRRIYVRAVWRRQGIGALLISTMLADARQSFHTIRLRADNPTAARLYETFGFQPYDDPNATHLLHC